MLGWSTPRPVCRAAAASSSSGMQSFELDQRTKRIRDSPVQSGQRKEQGKNVVFQRTQRVPNGKGTVHGGWLLYPVSCPPRGHSTEMVQDNGVTDE